MEAFIFILKILGASAFIFFYLGEGWKRPLDKLYKKYFDEEKQQDEEEKQDKSSTEKTGGANP